MFITPYYLSGFNPWFAFFMYEYCVSFLEFFCFQAEKNEALSWYIETSFWGKSFIRSSFSLSIRLIIAHIPKHQIKEIAPHRTMTTSFCYTNCIINLSWAVWTTCPDLFSGKVKKRFTYPPRMFVAKTEGPRFIIIVVG